MTPRHAKPCDEPGIAGSVVSSEGKPRPCWSRGLELARRLGDPYARRLCCLDHLSMVTTMLHSFAWGGACVEGIAIAAAHGWRPRLIRTRAATLDGIEAGRDRVGGGGVTARPAEQVLRPGTMEPGGRDANSPRARRVLSARGRDEEAIDAFRESERRRRLLVGAARAAASRPRGFLAQSSCASG